MLHLINTAVAETHYKEFFEKQPTWLISYEMYRPHSVECLANISTVVIPEDDDDEKKGYESGYPSGCL